MNAINEEPEPQELEALLPWYAAGTLSRRDANRVERALADDRELARQNDLVREELVETIHLNETLGVPSARAMERLFAAIDAEEARAPRHRRWFDLGSRISEFLWSLTPRTLARSAMAAALAILLQAAVIASVVVKEQGSSSGPELASAPNEGSYALMRFAPAETGDRSGISAHCLRGRHFGVSFLGAHPLAASGRKLVINPEEAARVRVISQNRRHGS